MATEAPSTGATFASPCKKERDVTVEAVNHLIQGKRHLLVQDIPSAVTSLQEACRLLTACYGELANEVGDAYYYYGLALLEMSRRESGVLGNGKDGSASEADDDEDDEDEGEEENENEDDDDEEKDSAEEDSKSSELREAKGKSEQLLKPEGGSENGETKPKVDSEAKSEDLEDSKKADEGDVKDNTNGNNECTKSNDKASTAIEAGSTGETSSSAATLAVARTAAGSSSSASSSTNGAQPSTSSSGSSQPGTSSSNPSQPCTSQDKPKEPDDDEDISNLQLAWEVLELAKVIFKRQAEGSQEMQLKLANVYSKLGEVAMESENYDQSVEDLLECLGIQRQALSADNRNIAETYYQLGLAYSFSSQFDMSIGNFHNAVGILEKRIASLETVASTKSVTGKSMDDDPVAAAQEEIKELKELVPEIKEKILDTEDLKKNSVKLPEAMQELEPESAQPDASSNTNATNSPLKVVKPVTNIGHLVRKKRKTDEDGDSKIDSGKDSKRLREDNAFSAALAASTEVLADSNKS